MADHIQIGDISPRIQYTGNGAQTAFTYPFPIFADADMAVFEDTTQKILTTDYTVSGAGASSGGSVTFVTAPVNGVTVTLKRQLAIQRTSDFQESGEFRSKVINDELDYLVAALQQVDDGFSRSLRLPETDTATSLTLPEKSARSSMYLGFDASGDPIATDATGPAGPTGPAGNMDGANNLSELTAVATARTNLGLGTAATKNTGTANGDVVLLDATGLPAVDGSQLTGLSVGATAAEKANIMLNAFRIAINGGLSVQNMVDGVVDEFEDETGVDVGTSTNEGYDAVNDLYTNTGGLVEELNWAVATAGSTLNFGGAAAALQRHLGAKFTASQSGTMTEAKFEVASVTTGGNVHAELWTNNAGSPGAQIGVDSASVNITGTGTATFTFATPPAIVAATDYWIVFVDEPGTVHIQLDYTAVNTYTGTHNTVITSITVSGGNDYRVSGISQGAALDMTLVSNATTALATPATAFIVIWQEDVAAITLNTDLKAYASRDGGTTWNLITLTEEATLTTGRILTGSVTLTSTGTSMKYKIETLNTKDQRIHGVGLQWS